MQKDPCDLVLVSAKEEEDECQPTIFHVSIIIIIRPLPSSMSYQMSLKIDGLEEAEQEKKQNQENINSCSRWI